MEPQEYNRINYGSVGTWLVCLQAVNGNPDIKSRRTGHCLDTFFPVVKVKLYQCCHYNALLESYWNVVWRQTKIMQSHTQSSFSTICCSYVFNTIWWKNCLNNYTNGFARDLIKSERIGISFTLYRRNKTYDCTNFTVFPRLLVYILFCQYFCFNLLLLFLMGFFVLSLV